MQNHRRRQYDQLSRLLCHPHRRLNNSKTPPQQRHFNGGSKVYDIGHIRFLFDDSPEKKRICKNETFWFSRNSNSALQLMWKVNPIWICLFCHQVMNVWASLKWNPCPNTTWNTPQCPWLSPEKYYTRYVDTWMAAYLFHARHKRFWGKVWW